MFQTFKTYFRLLRAPKQTWTTLLSIRTTEPAHFYSVYGLMAFIIPFSMVGKAFDIACLDLNVLISDALLTFASLFMGLHMATSAIKLYLESMHKQRITYNDCFRYTAYASAGVFATAGLVELTQMPAFWISALYSLKVVLESVQTGYIQVDDQKKYSAIWIITLFLIAAPYLAQLLIGMMINI